MRVPATDSLDRQRHRCRQPYAGESIGIRQPNVAVFRLQDRRHASSCRRFQSCATFRSCTTFCRALQNISTHPLSRTRAPWFSLFGTGPLTELVNFCSCGSAMALRQASLAGSRVSTALRREATRRRSKGTPSALAGGLGSGHAAAATAGGGSSRQIHPSGRKEMLPVIGGALAVAAVATGVQYLIRAG